MKLGNRSRRAGFTLVEVLIVVVILGILAATVLPQFTQASKDAKETSLVQNLQMMRHQISMYKFQHEGDLPAQGSTVEQTFIDHLTKRTDLDNTVNEAAGKFGPYVLGQIPANPYNNQRAVTVKDTALAPADYAGSTTIGWVYSSKTGELRASVAPTVTSVVEAGKAVNSF